MCACGAQELSPTDINGDGRIDIVACHQTAATTFKIIVYPGMANGTFAMAATTVTFVNAFTFQQVTQLRVADLNHDNQMDLVISGRFMAGTGPSVVGFVYALMSNVTGASLLDKQHDLGNLPSSLFVHDMNHDSFADVVAAIDLGQSSVVAVTLADGTGGFRPAVQYPIGPTIKLTRIARAHLDPDGNADAVLWDRTSPRIRFLLGNNDGSLRQQDFETVLPGNPTSVRVVDVNGDNLADVVAGYGSSRAIQVFLGM